MFKILHVASFVGNIGDNASHMGLHNILKSIVKIPFTIDEMEIRRFYKNYNLPDKMMFDSQFVHLANCYDLLIIGGGGFLDYWVANSRTGTTIDISKEDFDRLTVPTLITSIGSFPHKDIPEGNIEKFHDFLKQIFDKDNVRIAFRNDGSADNIHRLFGDEFNPTTILDNGFFYKPKSDIRRLVSSEYVAINTTLDQLKMKNLSRGILDIASFENEMRRYVQFLIDNTNYQIVFVPHIYQDMKAISEILSGINDFYIRTRIVIAPYIQGYEGCNLLMSIYNNASLVVGMRFHTNVCSAAMGVPLISLAALERVEKAMKYIGLDNNVIPVDSSFSSEIIINKMNNIDTKNRLLEEKMKSTNKTYMKMFSELKLDKIINEL